jgi:hypothetical protein
VNYETPNSSHKLKMKLIAHIGLGKTGTSSIQETLSLSTAELKKISTVYLGLNLERSPVKIYPWQRADGWRELIRNGKEQSRRQLGEVLSKTMNMLEKEGVKKVIWSNESMISLFDLVGYVLQGVRSSGIKVEVICYLRRHDEWARSAYMQWGIKHKLNCGKVRGFSEWLASAKINFSSQLAPWLAAKWDNISIRNFDVYPDVVKDFLDYCEIPSNVITSIRSNKTTSEVALAFWALYNSQIEEPVLPINLEPLLQRTGVLGKQYKHVDLDNLFPNEKDMSDLLNNFRTDIEAVNSIFASCGQPPIEEQNIKSTMFGVSTEKMFSALIDIVRHQDSELVAMCRRLKRLEDKISSF